MKKKEPEDKEKEDPDPAREKRLAWLKERLLKRKSMPKVIFINNQPFDSQC